MSSADEVVIPGFAQMPSNDTDRCSVCGLRRGMLRQMLGQWIEHPVVPVRTVYLGKPGAKRSITLYNKDDLYRLLNYEAEQQQQQRKTQ